MITDISQLDLSKSYSYADYLNWRLTQTVELIKGKIFKMSPAPRTGHQRVSWNFSGIFYRFVKQTDCHAFAAPFDVKLYDRKKSEKANEEIFTVVKPDICIVCDKTKIDEMGCNGSPDLIIEILSPGNSKKEMKIKYELYEETGVREYWIADPERQTIQIFALDENEKYKHFGLFVCDDIATSAILPELKLDLTQIFEDAN